MTFHIILLKTLKDLLSPKRTIALVLLGIFFPVIFSLIWRDGMSSTPMSLEMETHYITDSFSVILFMWVTGFCLVVTVATTAAGFISKEDTDGTLLIMVSKPVNRYELVLGKFLALVINAMLIQTVVLFLLMVLFWIILPIDPETLETLLGMIPWLILYSLLVTVVFGSIAIALSTLMKSRVKIMLVLMIAIIWIFFVGIIPRVAFSNEYEQFYLYYGDLGYHLGNTYTIFMDNSEAGQMMPQNQPYMSIFAGTYKGFDESFDPDIGALPPSLELTNYLSPEYSTAAWLGISAIALALAMWAIERKEVH